MESKWIPIREALPTSEDWVLVQTQDGTVFPASYAKNSWHPLFRGGLVEQLMHGRVAFWMPRPVGYPYVQCSCGSFYLQIDGKKECPLCETFHKGMPKKEEPLPFTDPPSDDDELLDDLFADEEQTVSKPSRKKKG